MRSFAKLLAAWVLLAAGWVPAAAAQDGRALAERWCQSCHMFPEPSLLDRRTWIDAVLPEMGARLGFELFRGEPRGGSPEAPAWVYPAEPVMPEADFDAIVDWYEAEAPAELEPGAWPARTALTLFVIERPERPADSFPTHTAVFIDAPARRLLVGNSLDLSLEVHAADLARLGRVDLGGAVSRIVRLAPDRYLVTTMGETIGPGEVGQGELLEIAVDRQTGTPSVAGRLARDLPRPVDLVWGDFNGDGATDIVSAGFGSHAGRLTLHLGRPGGGFTQTVLLDEPGAISVALDGGDLLVLMAQGDERILRLRDFADGRPAIETLARFPPVSGGTSLKALDFDGDGIRDLLTTAGDNGDLSPILKPYHGITLHRGQADGSFRQAFFFPFDGAYAAVAEDFDLDGDRDIAAISYFPDPARDPDEAGFVYLENTGEGFAARFVEGLGHLGRFVAMAVGDLDGDGDPDLALANVAFGPTGAEPIAPSLQRQWIDSTGLVVLRNRRR